MEILFATSNSHKVSEAEGILGPLGHTVLPLLVDGSPLRFVEPQADGIEEVAFSKLEQAMEATSGELGSGTAILVEDSGLFVDSLKGFPGPYSSYVEGTIGLEGVLSLLGGDEHRGAEYRAVAVLGFEGGTLRSQGICRGTISLEPAGTNGFGYDPIFVPDEGDGRTCGEMSPEEKSEVSHRARALKAMSELLNPPSK